MDCAMGLDPDILDQLQAELDFLLLRSGPVSHYVGIGQAASVMTWLTERGYHIVGFEGFTCDGRSIRPVEIADLGNTSSPEEALEGAHRILRHWTTHVEWIDITVAGRA